VVIKNGLVLFNDTFGDGAPPQAEGEEGRSGLYIAYAPGDSPRRGK
jgi:hypothetical protein